MSLFIAFLRRFFSLLTLSAIAFSATAQTTQPGKRVALVIGNANYAHASHVGIRSFVRAIQRFNRL